MMVAVWMYCILHNSPQKVLYFDFVICLGFCNSLGFFFSRVIFNIYLQFDENACFISQQAQLADNALVRKINHSFS